jgi:hypothetical protein
MSVSEEFVEVVLNYLSESKFDLRYPLFEVVECDDKGRTTLKIEVVDRFYLNDNSLFDKNIIIQILVFFSLIDGYIDKEFSDLVGKTFRKKYDELDVGNNNVAEIHDEKLIMKETYRVFKLLRNACVHSIHSIDASDRIKIEYEYRNTQYKLNISKDGFGLLLSMVVIIIDERISPEKYRAGIMRTYFKDVLESITVFEDDIEKPIWSALNDINGDVFLARNHRYQVKNVEVQYAKHSETIKIINSHLYNYKNNYSSMDYIVEIKGKHYKIPDEILDTASCVSLSDLEGYEV